MVEIHITHWPFIRWRKGESMSEKAVGGLALSISTLANSTFNSYAKVLTGALSSISILFVSEILTAFFVLFSYGTVPIFRSIGRLHKKDMMWVMITGFFNGIIGPLFLFAGLYYTTAVNASFFGNMQMVFTVLLAAWILGERILPGHYAAIFTIMAGTVIISLKGFTDGMDLQFGDVLVILSSLGYAFGSVFYRKYLSHVEAHVALFVRSALAIGIFFAVSPFPVPGTSMQ